MKYPKTKDVDILVWKMPVFRDMPKSMLFGISKGEGFMAYYGYHRVSTKNQHEDRGITEIEAFCKQKNITLSSDIFCDKQTGKNFNRPEYQFIRGRIQRGDTLIITEMDRLGRNKAEILKELQYFRGKGVYVIILEIPTTQQDYSNLGNEMSKLIMEAINNMLIEMYAVFAQVEIQKKEKRQREGIAAKKLRGEWDDYGRPAARDYKAFAAAYAQVEQNRIKPTELRRELGLSHSTFYRYRDRYIKEKG